MKVVDANVLLYAINPSEPMHDRAHAWLDGALTGVEPVGFSWVVLLGFLRVSTLLGAFPNPLTTGQALGVAEEWLRQRAAVVLEPTPCHLSIMRQLLEPVGTGGNLVPDAHLAALAIEHRGEVVSFDNDFARYPGLRWRRPGE